MVNECEDGVVMRKAEGGQNSPVLWVGRLLGPWQVRAEVGWNRKVGPAPQPGGLSWAVAGAALEASG